VRVPNFPQNRQVRLNFEAFALSSIQVNNKATTGDILALPILKEIMAILTFDEEDTDEDN
jgi:N-acetylglucosamine kinase-like BadF-type ATPase